MHKWGAAAAYCCARLLVARANRAVIVFAMFCSVFCPNPFQRLWSCSLLSFLNTLTPPRIIYNPSKSSHSFRSICLVPQHVSLHSFLHLPCPQKTPLHSKNIRQPCVFNVGCQRPLFKNSFVPHFVFFVRAISASHPRFTRYRLAPLTTASRESTSLRSAAFPLAFVRLKAALPALFSASPTHSPRPPTPKESGIAVV